MQEQSKAAARKRQKTNRPGVFWKGTDKNRRYEIAWRCHGTCPPGTCSGQHWERAYGDIKDAVELRRIRTDRVEELRAKLARGEAIHVAPARTFKQVAVEYMDSPAFTRLAPGTQAKYRGALELRCYPTFGDRPVVEVTTDEIAAWLTSLRTVERKRKRAGRVKGLAESTINGALTALRVVFKFAASRSKRYVVVDPVAALEEHELPTPGADARPVQVLDETDLARLLAGATPESRLLLEVKARTGLRSSELRALVWSDLDLRDRLRVTVSRQIDDEDRGERVAIKDRSLTEHRFVPLTDVVADKLRDHHARRAEHGPARPDDFVFGDGRHLKHGALDEAFRTAVEAAGIERDPGKRLSPHSLRHGYGSLLLAHGEQLSNVSAWLGHRKVSTTEKWYAHQIETLLDLAADRMRERERTRQIVATS